MQKRAEKSHYQSKVFVCVSNNHTDAVDRLSILGIFFLFDTLNLEGHDGRGVPNTSSLLMFSPNSSS